MHLRGLILGGRGGRANGSGEEGMNGGVSPFEILNMPLVLSVLVT